MKNYISLNTALFVFFVLYIFSLQKVSSQEPEKKDRNMFGHYIPRGVTIHTEGLTSGYVMFSPTNSASVYLVNRKGEVVHEWKGNYSINSAYLNDDGSISLLATDPDFPVFAGGGEAGRIQKISWDSKMLWDFEYANEDHLAHHDIAVMPNGNVLAIAWEARSAEDVINAGRKPDMTPKAGLWTSQIVEIQPLDKTHGKVVWEWKIWDHLIQDYDSTKRNFGNVADHLELLDFNAGEELPEPITQDSLDVLRKMNRVRRNTTLDNRGSDVYHLNAIYYNAELDQIAFSSPELSEVFIIDHSTTTQEAASHRGGKMGKGGDFLYRWGNPQNYRQGDSLDRQLFYQHDIRWIENGFPGYGSLTLFNNDIPGRKDSLNYSAIYQIKPLMDDKGNYILMDNNRFGPKEPEWKYIAKDTISFHGSFISGAHRLKNGNTFINEGPRARFFEVTPEGDIVWEYLSPYRGNIHRPNGDPINPMPFTYSMFRSNFIPADHPGLKGKVLEPLDPQPPIFKLPPKEEKKNDKDDTN
ncbi:arylsulfotransferase ASST [Flavobacteriaceae bacterium MAR_2010_72]|nr:arylsulfotransferase ASST [Flavobacteriaceae bacterium MAR_2010_72]